jgi:hypothetical protein
MQTHTAFQLFGLLQGIVIGLWAAHLIQRYWPRLLLPRPPRPMDITILGAADRTTLTADLTVMRAADRAVLLIDTGKQRFTCVLPPATAARIGFSLLRAAGNRAFTGALYAQRN